MKYPLCMIVCLIVACAHAEPTRVLIHVQSKDAKFIGTSMGGVQILIRNEATGELLAKGVTAGSTGDTALLVKEPHERYRPLATPDAASYLAELDLTEPTRIVIEATGPLAQRQAATTVTLHQWVFPGQHIDQGDGILLELPGFVVDVLSPPAHVKLSDAGEIKVTANITMMCGCPITPDGLWDANRFQITGRAVKNGKPAGTFEMTYAGQASQFAGTFKPDGSGAYELQVLAFDPRTGNTGLDSTTVIVP